jgi:putative transposase
MKRKAYPTDLTDKEWELLEPLIPLVKPGGRPREVDMREIVNAIVYQLRSGGAWRLLPHDFPNWSTVYGYFNRWAKDGTWERINAQLRRDLRVTEGRDPEPSAAIMDSQSVKTTEKGGHAATTRARK